MSEAPDPLEEELSALRPEAVSPGFRRHIARRLAEVPPAPRPRLWRLALAGGLAAACVLAALAWFNREGKPPGPGSGTGASARQVRPPAPNEPVRASEPAEARRAVDGVEMLTFRWPLPVTTPATPLASISPDLFE
jgi:hypothetical protein